MQELGKILAFFGVILLMLGAIFLLLGRTTLPIGRLPGEHTLPGEEHYLLFSSHNLPPSQRRAFVGTLPNK
jgi:hypothetical protein